MMKSAVYEHEVSRLGLSKPNFGAPEGDHWGSKEDPPDEHEIRICRAWLLALQLEQVRLKQTSSYVLKHRVEAWSRMLCGALNVKLPTYVSNGALIVAAIREGYSVQASDGPNALITDSQ